MARFWKNKVVWITGASSGIGEALAYQLAAKGARLILSARRKEELERVKGNCSVESQAGIRILPVDLASPTTLKLSTDAAIQTFGFVDILINNGGVGQRSLVKETDMETDRRIMEVNYFGTIAVSKFLLPHFIERKSGHFVVVSSVMGKIGTPFRSGYAASKHALHGFFDSLRAETWSESKKIYVTFICPGWIQTGLKALAGDGEILTKGVTKGIPVDVFSRKMLRAVEQRKKEVYIGGFKEKNAVRLKRLFPSLLVKFVRNLK